MRGVALGVTGWGAGQRARIGILTKVFTAELVDAATAKHERAERRRRLLPARLVVYLVLALCPFARESYEEVLRVLTSGIPGSRALARVNRSSLCRARSRLGEDVQPPRHPPGGASRRLVPVDGTSGQGRPAPGRPGNAGSCPSTRSTASSP
ncbi:transposase domain-containing protein [Streptomyces sp. C10-9-1]|uniref:transposase domain-containing protein n=1 Tax=Streptomyces sp. C10-9-1 TaxID=1859285 RepID=UPI003D70FE77